jgi:hypothetical protein
MMVDNTESILRERKDESVTINYNITNNEEDVQDLLRYDSPVENQTRVSDTPELECDIDVNEINPDGSFYESNSVKVLVEIVDTLADIYDVPPYQILEAVETHSAFKGVLEESEIE